MATTKHMPPSEASTTDDPSHLHALLEEFPTVLLGTFEECGERPVLRARPMAVARLGDDCTLYFVTQVDTGKVLEAQTTGYGHAFGQSKQRFFSLRGTLELTQNRALLEGLWTKLDEVWLAGPDDPRAAVLILRPEEAELWDLSGSKGLRFVFDAARALAFGTTAPAGEQREQHEHVRING